MSSFIYIDSIFYLQINGEDIEKITNQHNEPLDIQSLNSEFLEVIEMVSHQIFIFSHFPSQQQLNRKAQSLIFLSAVNGKSTITTNIRSG